MSEELTRYKVTTDIYSGFPDTEPHPEGDLVEHEEAQRVIQSQQEEIDRLSGALTDVHKLICEGAKTGFNPLEGEWAEKLFRSNGKTYDALNNKALSTQTEKEQ